MRPTSRPRRGPEQRRPTDRFPENARLPLAYRLIGEPADAGASDPHARNPRLARLEAVLFLADEPITIRKLTAAAGLADAAETRRLVQRLRELYDADATAFQIDGLAGGFQLLTRPAYRPWLIRAQRTPPEIRLSGAAQETLAVVAYRQPIMRADVEAIRGVGCGELLTQLMEKGLVKIVGRHDSLGRPVLYGTTKKFLQNFGLNSLRDLPNYEGPKKEPAG